MDLMHRVFHEYLDKFVIVFIDDILIYSRTAEEHEQHLRIVLGLLREHKLYAKLKKYVFWLSYASFLGHVISDKGLSMDPSKIAAVVEWPRPNNVSAIRKLFGSSWILPSFCKEFLFHC